MRDSVLLAPDDLAARFGRRPIRALVQAQMDARHHDELIALLGRLHDALADRETLAYRMAGHWMARVADPAFWDRPTDAVYHQVVQSGERAANEPLPRRARRLLFALVMTSIAATAYRREDVRASMGLATPSFVRRHGGRLAMMVLGGLISVPLAGGPLFWVLWVGVGALGMEVWREGLETLAIALTREPVPADGGAAVEGGDGDRPPALPRAD